MSRKQTFKICENCKNEFGPVDRLSRKFCSRQCKADAQTGVESKSKGVSRPHTYRARVAVCPVCSKEFRSAKDYGDRRQIYCSLECRGKKNPPVEINCLSCNSVFMARPGTKKYCSMSCRNTHYQVVFSGEKSHLWDGGKTGKFKLMRTSAEYRKWRKAVFERDGFSCVACGVRSSVGVRVELQADHIKPLSEFPELAFDVSNGRTLCRPCHKETDTWGWKQSSRIRNRKADNDNNQIDRVAI